MDVTKSRATATWFGDLMHGGGRVTSESKVLFKSPAIFTTNKEGTTDTDPEELLAAANATCFCMALAHALQAKGYTPQRLETEAICTLSAIENVGYRITKMHLHVRGMADDIDETTFRRLAEEAEGGCAISNAIRGNVAVTVEAELFG